MDYEKKHKKALEIIKGNLDALNEIAETGAEVVNIKSIKNCFYKAFPELKENEDDKLREQVVYAINQLYVCECTKDKLLSWLDTQVSPDMVADAYLRGCNDTEKKWFEKQDKQKDKISVTEDLYEHIRNACCCIEDAMTCENTKDMEDYLNQASYDAKSALDMIEKQGEESYTYNPYKATIESILDMCKRYSESGDLLDFFNNVEVKCKDAIEYDETWFNKQG